VRPVLDLPPLNLPVTIRKCGMEGTPTTVIVDQERAELPSHVRGRSTTGSRRSPGRAAGRDAA